MLELPPGILSLIGQHCPFETVNNFRLTSKRINEACLDSFKKGLATHCVALDECSIERLINIAEHEEFRFCVERLIISTAHLPRLCPEDIARGYSTQYNLLREIQQKFVHPGLTLMKLRDAVKGLVRCASITLTDADHKIPRGITRMLANALALGPQNDDDILSVYDDHEFVKHALYATLAAFTAASHATDLSIEVGEPCLCFDDLDIGNQDCPGSDRALSLVSSWIQWKCLSCIVTFAVKKKPIHLKLVLEPSAVVNPERQIRILSQPLQHILSELVLQPK